MSEYGKVFDDICECLDNAIDKEGYLKLENSTKYKYLAKVQSNGNYKMTDDIDLGRPYESITKDNLFKLLNNKEIETNIAVEAFRKPINDFIKNNCKNQYEKM